MPSGINKYQNQAETIGVIFIIQFKRKPARIPKIITLSATLNEGLVDLDKETFYDSGSVKVANAKIKCWKAGGHGAQTFLQVVENSCNLGVYTRTLISL